MRQVKNNRVKYETLHKEIIERWINDKCRNIELRPQKVLSKQRTKTLKKSMERKHVHSQDVLHQKTVSF